MSALTIFNRMMDTVPDQYHTSRIYKEIQLTVAHELARIEEGNEDLRLQLHVRTATWGLKHWETAVGIPVNEAATNETRRSRILGRLRSIGNFSIAMIRSIAAAYTSRPLLITIDFDEGVIEIEFIGDAPADVSGFQKQVSDIIHAHLGVVYRVVVRGEAIHIDSRVRSYEVPLPITNTLVTTSNEYGKVVSGTAAIDSRARTYVVRFPVCNETYVGG